MRLEKGSTVQPIEKLAQTLIKCFVREQCQEDWYAVYAEQSKLMNDDQLHKDFYKIGPWLKQQDDAKHLDEDQLIECEVLMVRAFYSSIGR